VALRTLIEAADAAATRSAGPRFFHFVMGGGTPGRARRRLVHQRARPDRVQLGQLSVRDAARADRARLAKELFRLPAAWSGVLTSAATTANFTGLAAARRWWGHKHEVDVEEAGLSGLPPVPVLSSGYVHASAVKALAMLGIGRQQVQTFAADATGRLDVGALERALYRLDGAPAILIGTRRGERWRIRSDSRHGRPSREARRLAPRGRCIRALRRDLARNSGARNRDRSRTFGRGGRAQVAERPVRLRCGVRPRPELHSGAFSASAAYLGREELDRPVFSNLVPEMSRRAPRDRQLAH
jgi:hypothetical protein